MTKRNGPEMMYTLATHPDAPVFAVVWAEKATGRVHAIATEFFGPDYATQAVIDFARMGCRDPRTTRKMLRWHDVSALGATVEPYPRIGRTYDWTCDHDTALRCVNTVGAR